MSFLMTADDCVDMHMVNRPLNWTERLRNEATYLTPARSESSPPTAINSLEVFDFDLRLFVYPAAEVAPAT